MWLGQNYFPHIKYVRELFIVAETSVTNIAKNSASIINNTKRIRIMLKWLGQDHAYIQFKYD